MTCSIQENLESQLVYQMGEERLETLFNLGQELRLENPTRAITVCTEGLTLCETSLVEKCALRFIQLLAEAHYHNNDFEISVRYGLQALEYYEIHNETAKMAIAYSNLGIAQRKAGYYDKAMAFQKKALSLAINTKNQGLIAQTHNNMGTLYVNLQQFDKARNEYYQAIEIQEHLDDALGVALSKNNIATLSFETNNAYDEALVLLQESAKTLYLLERQHDICEVVLNMGKIHTLQKNFEIGLQYLKKGAALAQRLDNASKIVTAKRYLSHYYKTIGNDKKALHCIEEAEELYNKIIAEKNNNT